MKKKTKKKSAKLTNLQIGNLLDYNNYMLEKVSRFLADIRNLEYDEADFRDCKGEYKARFCPTAGDDPVKKKVKKK